MEPLVNCVQSAHTIIGNSTIPSPQFNDFPSPHRQVAKCLLAVFIVPNAESQTMCRMSVLAGVGYLYHRYEAATSDLFHVFDNCVVVLYLSSLHPTRSLCLLKRACKLSLAFLTIASTFVTRLFWSLHLPVPYSIVIAPPLGLRLSSFNNWTCI